ncbi:Hypothetical predicted protein [Paramuricea clavata]|uniref:Uncharacterized protein n=1 Tax=Paramuricea clavata TaxID=317549 RepID=A0A6S7G0G2_PARCT|nr:Hypothetical predicted protein [Paramuricea clavata]
MEIEIDFRLCEERKLRDGHYNIVFAHPETLVSRVPTRKDYGKLGVLCALFPDVPCLAMTATASRTDMNAIYELLGLKKCEYIVANPDRKNSYYKKVFRHGQDADAIQSILTPIAKSLLKEKTAYPLTIVYLPLRLCGFAYKLFEYVLSAEQYFPPGSAAHSCKPVFCTIPCSINC